MGWPDLLSELVETMMNLVDNLRDALKLSGYSPAANATDLQPYGYSQHHTPAHVAADHERFCNLLIPNGTTEFSNKNSRSKQTWSDKYFERNTKEYDDFR